jgi:hypothetical protein
MGRQKTMSNLVELSKANLSGGDSSKFLIRWRGRQEGPYPVSVIDAKLAANEIGLLHEIFHNGQWVTIRDYITEREAILRAENQAREEQARRAREEAERKAREREEKLRAATLAEDRRKNDLLAAGRERQNDASGASAAARAGLKPHRGGLILTLALIGLFVCGPLCLAAWVMGSGDLREMDAGMMDAGGRATTSSGRNVGILGTVLWLVSVVIIFVIGSH